MYQTTRRKGYSSREVNEAANCTPSSIQYSHDSVTPGDEIRIGGTLNPIVKNKLTSNLRIRSQIAAEIRNDEGVTCQTRTFILNGKMIMKKGKILPGSMMPIVLCDENAEKAAAVIRYYPSGEMKVDLLYDRTIPAHELHQFARDVVKHPKALTPPSSSKSKTRPRSKVAVTLTN